MLRVPVLLASALLLQEPLEAPDPGPGFTFPEGPVAEAVRGVLPKTAPKPAALGDDVWSDWVQYVRWLALENGGAGIACPPLSPSELLAGLTRIALQQGRTLDAWKHASRLTFSPEALAGLLPHFLPGIPDDATAAAGGFPAPLPDGVLLTPSIPPPTPGIPPGWIDRRAMEVRGFRVGEAELALRLTVEGDGVEIGIRHLGGSAAKLSVVIPVPAEYQMRTEYVDWERAETVGLPHAIEVKPGDDEHVLWGRFVYRAEAWPAGVPHELTAQLREGGLALVFEGDDPEREELERMGAALAELFEIPVLQRSPGEPPPPGDAVPVTLDLSEPGDTRERKVAALLSLAERFALATLYRVDRPEDPPR